MASISFDNATGTQDTGGAATSLTYSKTNTGSELILFVSAGVNTTSDVVTGITYNGVAMTRIDTATTTGNRSYLYYLLNPATGAHNVVVSMSGAFNIYSSAASYTGAKQSAQPDSSNTGTATTSPFTLSTTVVSNGCWLISTCVDLDGELAGTGTTVRSGSSTAEIGDSNGVVLTGSQNLGWDVSTTTSPSSGVIASFAPSSFDAPVPASGYAFII